MPKISSRPQRRNKRAQGATSQPSGNLKFIAQREFQQAIKQRYDPPVHAYFWDALVYLQEYERHRGLSWRRIATISSSAVQLLRTCPPFVLFTDHLAGWSGLPKGRRWSPLQFNSPDEAVKFIRTNSHFRDGTNYEDNYYLCDQSLKWFICCCHHDGWHLWAPKKWVASPAWRRWQKEMGVNRVTAYKNPARILKIIKGLD